MMASPRKRIRGFSLVEALVALTLIGLASSTLLLATASTVQSGNDATAQTIARGIAEQIIDDVLGQPYHEPGGSPTGTLGPDGGETANPPKSILFDDADDYANYSSSPPRDPWGIELGRGNGSGGLRPQDLRLPDDYFSNWNVSVSVTYVNPDDPTKDLGGGATSIARAVKVRITRNWNEGQQELVSIRRVFAYVPAIRSS